MQLGLYRTTFAAARLSSEFKISRIGKMMNRGMKSSQTGMSLNSPDNVTDKERALTRSYEDEYPSLQISIDDSKRSTKKTRRDLQHTTSKQKSEENQNIGPLQLEASAPITNQVDVFGKSRSSSRHPSLCEHGEATSISISNQGDTDLSTSFGKNRSSSSKNPKQCHTHHEHGDAKRRLTSSSMDEAFDICFPETRETNSSHNSESEKNRQMWAAKVESPDENEKHIDNMERSNSMEEDSAEEIGQVLRPGMVLFKHYLSLSEQVNIVNKCRELGRGPGGFYRPGYNDGAKLRLYMMCLGLDWDPQTKKYGDRRHHDDAEPPVIPQEFTSLVCRVLHDSHALIKRDQKIINVENELPSMSPDLCIVNFYNTNGRLGLHQDRDESHASLKEGLPVVSISIGDSADFLYGDKRDVDKAESVLLDSGDVLIFGGDSRHIYHGVSAIIRDTAPPALLKNTKLRPGRLNLTFRKY